MSIHPFADGNGRTVRLMQHLLLLRDGQSLARFVPSETAIMLLRDRYYRVLKQSRSLESPHPILEFLAECFAQSASQVVSDGKSLLKASSQRKPEARHRKIRNLAKERKTFTIQDVVEKMPEVPRRTLERDLEQLTKKKEIKATGKKRARVYSL